MIMNDRKACDQLVAEFEAVIKEPKKSAAEIYYTGVDLGTACIVLAVMDENFQPVAGAYRYADVVRDGMVVDYIGAISIVKELKAELEEKLDTELIYAAAAIHPGTDALDCGAIKNRFSFSEAELYKRDQNNHSELIGVLKPVVEKIATIITAQIEGFEIDGLYLVGGTACLT